MNPNDTKIFYWDSSALGKFIVRETESRSLSAFRRQHSGASHATSLSTRVEVGRIAGRTGDLGPVAEVLSGLMEIPLTPEIVARATALQPATLRSLDAIHLASALALGDALEAVVTYDSRLRAATELAGLRVVSPL